MSPRWEGKERESISGLAQHLKDNEDGVTLVSPETNGQSLKAMTAIMIFVFD